MAMKEGDALHLALARTLALREWRERSGASLPAVCPGRARSRAGPGCWLLNLVGGKVPTGGGRAAERSSSV